MGSVVMGACCSGRHAAWAEAEEVPAHDSPVSELFVTGMGQHWGYCQYGARENTALVCFYLHGLPGSRLELASVLPENAFASRGIRVVGVDRPGWGLSSLPENFQVRDMASGVTALADHLGVERFVVIG